MQQYMVNSSPISLSLVYIKINIILNSNNLFLSIHIDFITKHRHLYLAKSLALFFKHLIVTRVIQNES